jgi:hypothetical protein
LSLILIPSLQISEARKYQMKSVPTYPPKDYTKITKPVQEKQTVKQKIEQPKKPIKLNLISLSQSHATIGHSYGFSVRVYDAVKNPRSDYYQNWGYLQDVTINVSIKNQDGIIIKSFNGITGKNGHYSDSFRIPDDFKATSYVVILNATKEGFVADSDQTWLHVNYDVDRDESQP